MILTKLTRPAHVAFLLIALVSPGFAQAPLKVEPLKEAESLSGCGICFYIKSASEEQPQLFADDGGDARIRVNGQLHTLVRKSQRETSGPKKNSPIGSRTHEIWSDGQIEVILDYKVLKLGEENEHLKGTLTVSIGESKQTLRVEGDSGC